MEALLVAGIGVGLSSIAGIRAYLPLALVGLFAALGLFVLPEPLGILGSWVVVGALFVLALLETVLDKVPALDPLLDYVQTPVRIASGAVLFSAVLGAGVGVSALPELAIGAAIAGVTAVLKIVLRPPSAKAAGASASGVSTYFLSLFEDVVALVGGALAVAVFVPFVPLVLVAFLLFFFFRVRRRRGRKYGGLRILRD
jgi:Domain of unknown function (DUF4126)